ncbi:unnamed protein product [Rotaria sp. Silwood2]|nr:unnamed protein product [Rotaria sp. Silwood2]CAF4300210.1 unnamed protein product [Rotaria sp. Silwood2]
MTTTNSSIDAKEQLVSLAGLEQSNKQLREKMNNMGEKRSPPSDDEDITVYNMEDDGCQQMTPQGKKKPKTNNDIFFFNKKHSYNQRIVQNQSMRVNDEQPGQFNISNQALNYAVDNSFIPIKIECSPPLENREGAKKFVIRLFKYIENDFRKKYPGNQQPLGFHHWWIASSGKILNGVINDIELYMYLCDLKHYPAQIDAIKLIPDPPKRLPPQHTVVIKYVQNEIHKNDIEDELKIKYPSVFAIEDMMGTMRSNSRHIRVEIYQLDDYNKIINDGKIGLQGQIFEVEEYLAPPKILICTRCNIPGHMKKTCQSAIEICRRCGQDRNDGKNHNECLLKCLHCGGQHLATDYKCPTIVKFRQELLNRLKNDRNKLPPHVKLFIPVDCRTNADRSRFLISRNDTEIRNSVQLKPPTINPWTKRQYSPVETWNSNEMNITIKSLANELSEIKKNFEIEREKIKTCYEKQIRTIQQQGWVMIQQQIQAQNQYLSLMSTMMKDNLSVIGEFATTITSLSEIIKSKYTDESDQNKIEMMKTMINSSLQHIKNLNDSFIKQETNLHFIMNKQSRVFETALDCFLPTNNG